MKWVIDWRRVTWMMLTLPAVCALYGEIVHLLMGDSALMWCVAVGGATVLAAVGVAFFAPVYVEERGHPGIENVPLEWNPEFWPGEEGPSDER